MRKLLLIVGIISIVASALVLILALFNYIGYYGLADGSNELYSRLHHRMIVCFIIGIVLALIGTVCVIIRTKI